MSEDRFQLAVIVGSVREGRFGPVVADWFVGQAKRRAGMTLDVIDLADTPIPSVTFADRIAAADAFVVVTPEYNHGYPGPLKHAIDSVGGGWRAKPVGFVSYGGLSGGLRAVEPLRSCSPSCTRSPSEHGELPLRPGAVRRARNPSRPRRGQCRIGRPA